MGTSKAEARAFHNSKLADSIQSGRLGEGRYGANTPRAGAAGEQAQGAGASEMQQAQAQQAQGQQAAMIAARGQSQATAQQQLQAIQQKMKKKEEEIAIAHSELGEFYRMLLSQSIPIVATGGATFLEILDGGLISLIVTFFAICIRFIWFFLQSPKVKLWIRIKSLKQMIVSSVIAMIPLVGTLLQPDLISTAVITPYQTSKKIQSLKETLKQKRKEKKQLQAQQTQLMRTLRTQ